MWHFIYKTFKDLSRNVCFHYLTKIKKNIEQQATIKDYYFNNTAIALPINKQNTLNITGALYRLNPES